MTAPSSGSNPDSPRDDDVGDLGDEEQSGRAAADPEAARAAAEDALAQIEALAGLEEDPEPDGAGEGGDESTSPSQADVSSPTTGRSPEDQCENCGALLEGPYCSQCGQKAADRIVPIWHMINEALEAVFELDLRVIYTFPKFLFMPGRLTKEYINGRRKRYIRPFRLYLFATFLLFTVLALTTGQGFRFPFNPEVSSVQADTVQTESAAEDTTTALGGTGAAPAPAYFGSREKREEWARQLRTNPNTVDVQIGDAETQSQLERFLRIKVAEAIENPRDFVGSLIDRGPYVMFLMLPLFAFLLKLLYIRRRRLYVEHLIFSLHVHAFTFIAFTIGILMGQSDTGWVSSVGGWIDISPLLYLVVAMAHVYDQGIIKSSLKAFFLLTVYTIILTLGFIVGALTAVVFM